MNKIDLRPNFLKNTLFILFLLFPLSLVLRSASTNFTVLFISCLVIFFTFKRFNLVLLKDDLIKYLIIFFIYILLNSLWNYNGIQIFIKSLGNFRFLFLTLGVFLILSNISTNKKVFFLYINLILILAIGFDIIYQYIKNVNVFGFSPGMCEANLVNCKRYSGVFNDELIAGSFLSQLGLLTFILIDYFNFKKSFLSKIIKIIFCTFLFFVILLTGERNALLIFLIFFFFYFYLKKKLLIFFISSFIGLITIFLLALNLHSIKTRYVNIVDGWHSSSESTVQEKIINSPWSYHYQAAFELFLEKPIFGHGLKTFRIKCKDTKIDKKLIEQKETYKGYRACSTHPHNYMMEFSSEYGIIGLIFFIILFFKIFLKLYNLSNKKNHENLNIIIGIGSLLLAIIFPLKPSGSFFTTYNASIFFYNFGFFIYYLKQEK